MNLMAQMQQRWRELAGREQRLVLLTLVVLGLALVWWLAVAPALAILKAAPGQHQMLDAQLAQMQRLQAQAKVLQAQPALSGDESRRVLEASLKPLGAAAQMSSQGDRLTVTFKDISADALAQWLATARQNAHAVPSEAHWVRTPSAHWSGTVAMTLGARL
jgi:general secretion pathway protein M